MSDIKAVDPRQFVPLSTLSLHVLLSVGEKPAHGYAIGQQVERRSGGALNPTTGALYQALKRLRDEGLIDNAPAPAGERSGGPPRMHFRLTALGRKVVILEAERLEELLDVARQADLLPARGADRS